jgi:hypothetical protein
MCNIPYENFMLFDFNNINKKNEEMTEITYLGKFILKWKKGNRL